MEKRNAILGAMALLLILGALSPGAWAVTRIDKVNGAVTGVNLTTSGNFTVDWFTDVAGANTSLAANPTTGAAASGAWKIFCFNSTLGGDSGAFNTTCSFATSTINEGNLTLKLLVNYTAAGGAANSSNFEVHTDFTSPVTNASSITLEGGTRTRPGANRTISLIAVDTNYTVANCTLFINPEAPNGVQMTRDSANVDNFSYSFSPTWAGNAEAWAKCYDSHTRDTGLTTRVAFLVAGGGGVALPTVPLASGAVAAPGASKEIPRWAWALGGFAIVYILFFDKKGGKRKK